MKTVLLDVAGNTTAAATGADAVISFEPFTTYLAARAAEEHTSRAALYRQVLEQFRQQQPQHAGGIAVINAAGYEPLLEQVYTCLSPLLAPEGETAWGLCAPLQPLIFYGTEALYQLLQHEGSSALHTPVFSSEQCLQLLYSYLLPRFYHYHLQLEASATATFTITRNNLTRYYTATIDTQFVEATATGPLPELNCESLANAGSSGVYSALQEMLPLHLFRFSGFSVMRVKEVTTQCAVENIKNITLKRTPENDDSSYEQVMRSLQDLVQRNDIEFELFSFVRVNNKLVYGYQRGKSGVLHDVWGARSYSPERFHAVAESYSSNPNSFFSKDIDADEDVHNFLWKFREFHVRSLALRPVFYDNRAVGVLGLYTRHNATFNERILSMLEPAIPVLAQLLQNYIEEFNLEIAEVIKEKFTSIQSSVQWKFNEVAWQYLYQKRSNAAVEPETIIFRQVHPLYGAVDIRNSTMERNAAIRADISSQLQLVEATLTGLLQHHRSTLLDETLFTCRKWQQVIAGGELNATDETSLHYFLNNEINPFLEHVSLLSPATRPSVQAYLDAVREEDSPVFSNKRSLDASIQMITAAVNNYLESEKQTLQQSFPCYFEKFRTDGIEYDIYTGQSIAPSQPFGPFHLKHLRLWQLTSMAAIARITEQLLPSMPKALRTTQLIFVHNNTIDISFRNDERKFDVEGAYNIRYQMIKKRIDKVHIRNSPERLTQPGKIALIYFNRKEVEDYLQFIAYLQETGVLLNDLEELELEDLQGLSGLKALRVGVQTDA